MDDKRLTEWLLSYQRKRDPESIETLFEATAPQLWSLARRLTRNQADADDPLQSTYLAVLESVDRFRPRQPVMAWLTGILTNKARYQRRQNARVVDQKRLEIKPVPTPRSEASRAEEARAIEGAIAALPELYRRVLELVLREGIPPAEIAARLNRSPQAVRTQLHRGISLLRQALPVGVALPAVLLVIGSPGFRAIQRVVVERAREKGLASASATAGASKAAWLVLTTGTVATAAFVMAHFRGGDSPQPVGAQELVASREPDSAQSSVELTPLSSEDVALPSAVVELSDSTSPARSTIAPREPLTLTFQLGDDEGISLSTFSVVSEDQADLYFPSSNRLEVAEGFAVVAVHADVEDYEQKMQLSLSADALWRSLIAVDPRGAHAKLMAPRKEMGARARQIRFNDRKVDECVWVVRLPSGDWLSLARVNRVFNPTHERYETVLHGRLTGPEGVFWVKPNGRHKSGGFLFNWVRNDPFQEGIDRELRIRLDALDRAVARHEGDAWPTIRGESRVHGVLARRYAAEVTADGPHYEASTYSFDHGTRHGDHVGNDWSYVFDGSIKVRTVVSDRGGAWNLGPIGFSEVPGWSLLPPPQKSLRKCRKGDLLLIYTLDRDSDRWDLLKVLDVTERWFIGQWEPFRDDAWHARRAEELEPLRIPADGVWIRIRAKGGNPKRAFFDGSTNGYLDEVVDQPPKQRVPIDRGEGSRAFIQGGVVPTGYAWEVTSIQYEVTALGDSYPESGLRVVIDGEVVLEGTAPIGAWHGSIRLTASHRSYVEISGSCVADVRIVGAWIKVEGDR